MNPQKKEYLDERAGIRQFSGNQSEFAAMKGAEDDFNNYLTRNKSEKDNKYGYSKAKNNPFSDLKAMFPQKGTR